MRARPDHQEIVRDVNGHIRNVLEGFRAEHGHFLCECDELGCTERVALTLSDYDSLRDGQDGGRLLAPQHNGAAGLGVLDAFDPGAERA